MTSTTPELYPVLQQLQAWYLEQRREAINGDRLPADAVAAVRQDTLHQLLLNAGLTPSGHRVTAARVGLGAAG